MFTEALAFMPFYDVELVLSAIAKYLVHLLWEGEGCGEMGEGRGRGR